MEQTQKYTDEELRDAYLARLRAVSMASEFLTNSQHGRERDVATMNLAVMKRMLEEFTSASPDRIGDLLLQEIRPQD